MYWMPAYRRPRFRSASGSGFNVARKIRAVRAVRRIFTPGLIPFPADPAQEILEDHLNRIRSRKRKYTVHKHVGPSDIPAGYREMKWGSTKPRTPPTSKKTESTGSNMPQSGMEAGFMNMRKFLKDSSPVTGTSAKKKKYSRVGRYGGKFRMPRKKKATKMMKYHYEEIGKLTRQNVAYYGVSSIGGYARLLRPVVASFLMRLFKLADIQIEDHYRNIPVHTDNAFTSSENVNWVFKRVTEAGAVSYLDGGTVNLSGFSFDDVVNSLTTQLVEILNDSDTDHNVPVKLDFKSGSVAGSTDYRQNFQLNRLDEAFCKVICSQTSDIQNQTPADDDNKDIHTVESNPLKGKIYKFSDNVPRKRRAISYTLPFEQRDTKFTQGLIETGLDTDGIYALPDSSNENIMFQPPTGKSVWHNCVGESSCYMQPGVHKKLAITFKYSGKFINLLERMRKNKVTISETSYQTQSTIGTSFLLGLQPALRTVTNENIVLAIQKEQTNYGSVRFAKRPPMPAHVLLGQSFNA